MKNKKIILVLIALMVITSTIIMNGCGIAEKTTEYTFPSVVITSTGQTQDSVIEELKPSGSKDDLVTSIRKGEEGSIIIELTDSQKNIWLEDIEEKINQAKEDAKLIGCEIDINDEHDKLTYKISKDADIRSLCLNGGVVTNRCMQYQIFNGVSHNEVKLNTVFINIDTDKVLADINLGEEVTINSENFN